ncbi:MAG: mechanosensitive ion channel domain-containing protein [Saprospiraceae bacterium]
MIRIIKFSLKCILLFLLIYLKQEDLDHGNLPIFFHSKYFIFLLNFLIFWLALNIIIRFLQLIYRKRKKYGNKYSDNVIVGLKNIYYLVSFIALGITLLGLFGIEVKELVTALSILAASIAIITKDIALDIICGIQFSFSKDLALGDYVKIGDQNGTVIDINITKLILLNENDDIIYISNSKAYFSELINYTQKELRKYNVDFSIHTHLAMPLPELQNLVQKVLLEYEEYLDELTDNLKIIGISKDEIKYKIQFKLNQINPKIATDIKSKIMNAIINQMHRSI